MNEEIFKMARELGQLIVASEEYKRATETMDLLNNDETAASLITGYNQKRAAKVDSVDINSLPEDEIKEINEYLQNEFNIILENPVVKAYMQAQSEYENMVNSVNAILKFYISGRSEHSDEGCGGSCSTCGGCH